MKKIVLFFSLALIPGLIFAANKSKTQDALDLEKSIQELDQLLLNSDIAAEQNAAKDPQNLNNAELGLKQGDVMAEPNIEVNLEN